MDRVLIVVIVLCTSPGYMHPSLLGTTTCIVESGSLPVLLIVDASAVTPSNMNDYLWKDCHYAFTKGYVVSKALQQV